MTWKHVSLITAALVAVVTCGITHGCDGSLHEIATLATVVISGTLGHAGTNKVERIDDGTQRVYGNQKQG